MGEGALMRRFSIVLGCVLIMLGLALPAGAQELVVTVEDLVDRPAEYAAPRVPEVVVHGELVGDFGRRPNGDVWAQLNGDAYATVPLLAGGELAGSNIGIGVRIPAALWPQLADVAQAGGYRLRGPLVRFTGEWRYHDPQRGGESYLEVTRIEIYDAPVLLVDDANWFPFVFGVLLLGTASLIMLATRRRQQGR
jgi:hypothetical protein